MWSLAIEWRLFLVALQKKAVFAFGRLEDALRTMTIQSATLLDRPVRLLLTCYPYRARVAKHNGLDALQPSLPELRKVAHNAAY